MPRSGATYTLPEPAFITQTPISSPVMNTNNDDIADALTDSLARNGAGGMTAILPLDATGFNYTSDSNTGMKRTAADTQAIYNGGTNILTATTTGVSITGTFAISGDFSPAAPILGANGTVSLPAYSFASDPDSGAYRIGANNIGYAVNGAKVLDVATTGLAVTGALSATTSITAGNGLTVTTGTVALPAASVANAALQNGVMVSYGYAEDATNKVITGTTPVDDTIPQIGEGTEVISLAITSSSATEKWRIRASGYFAAGGAVAVIFALHRAGTNDALQATLIQTISSNSYTEFFLEYLDTPGSGAKTYSIRSGTAAAQTVRINGDTANRFLGGSSKFIITAEAIKA